MIEAEGGGGVNETGVETTSDLNQASLVTSAVSKTTGVTITYTPYSDSAVTIKVNGIAVNLGDGTLSEACYFSSDGGTTPRLIADISAGDTLYWDGSIAGYELEATDDIDISYEKSSLD